MKDELEIKYDLEIYETKPERPEITFLG